MAKQETWRRNGIGASEAPAAVGLSPWDSPLGLYLRKIGEGPSIEQNEAMRWGQLLEPVVLAEFERRSGRKLVETQARCQHADLPWLWATVDGLLDSPPEIVEAKTAGQWAADEWGEDGTDEIPEPYIVQTAVQLACSGVSVVHIPVLIAGQDYRCFRLERNEALITRVLELLTEFWQRVQERRPPPATMPRDSRLMDAIYPPDPAGEIELGQEALELARACVDAKNRIKTCESAHNEAKGKLIEMMGTAGTARLPEGWLIRRKRIDRTGYEVKATSFTDFRVVPAQKDRKETKKSAPMKEKVTT